MLDRYLSHPSGLIWLKDVPAVGGYTGFLEGLRPLLGGLVSDRLALTADDAPADHHGGRDSPNVPAKERHTVLEATDDTAPGNRRRMSIRASPLRKKQFTD